MIYYFIKINKLKWFTQIKKCIKIHRLKKKLTLCKDFVFISLPL